MATLVSMEPLINSEDPVAKADTPLDSVKETEEVHLTQDQNAGEHEDSTSDKPMRSIQLKLPDIETHMRTGNPLRIQVHINQAQVGEFLFMGTRSFDLLFSPIDNSPKNLSLCLYLREQNVSIQSFMISSFILPHAFLARTGNQIGNTYPIAFQVGEAQIFQLEPHTDPSQSTLFAIYTEIPNKLYLNAVTQDDERNIIVLTEEENVNNRFTIFTFSEMEITVNAVLGFVR